MIIVHVCVGILVLFLTDVNTEQILDKNNEDFDFDGLPGVAYEFKIEVQAGKQECFYQKIAKGARLFVSFEVLKGGDRLVDVLLIDPQQGTIEMKPDIPDGVMDHELVIEGVYKLCIDNTASVARYFYGSKLVYIYISTHVQDDWDKYIEEIEGVHLTVSNFSTSISAVQRSTEVIGEYQLQSRMNVVKDWYLITGINTYIVWWSILQICIIIFIYGFQVYFVRRLFKIPMVTQTSKPRA